MYKPARVCIEPAAAPRVPISKLEHGKFAMDENYDIYMRTMNGWICLTHVGKSVSHASPDLQGCLVTELLPGTVLEFTL